MGRLKTYQDLSNVEGLEELQKFISQMTKDIVDTINGKINVADNLECRVVSVTFSQANVDKMVNHKLGRIPSGFIQVSPSVALTVYTGSGASDENNIFVKSSAAGSASIMVFA